MVVLNLRDFSVPLSTNFGRGMTDKRFLELEITEWLRSPERKKQLAGEHYYHGDQEAAHRRRCGVGVGGKAV